MEVMYPHLQRSARLLYGPDGGVSAVGTRIFRSPERRQITGIEQAKVVFRQRRHLLPITS